MNFKESICNYILENYSIKDLPKIAEIAMMENLESESLFILAGMSEKDNSLEILEYFQNSLNELKICLPDKRTATIILTKYYLSTIINNPNLAFKLMEKLDNEVYKKLDFEKVDKKYVGEELKLEYLYTWYREIQDFDDNGMLLYYQDLPKQKQREKFEQNIVEEAKKTLKNNYT